MTTAVAESAPAAQPRFNNLGLALKHADKKSLRAFFAALQDGHNPHGRVAAEIHTCLQGAGHLTLYDAVKGLKRFGVTNRTIEVAAREHLNN